MATKYSKDIGDRFTQFFMACMLTPIINPATMDLESCRWGIPLNLIGGSGVGKSEIIGNLGSMLGQPTWVIYSATKSPEHFAGVFVPSPDGEVHVVCGLPQVKDALICRGGIILLDEVSCAPNSVQAALLSFVHERRVGEYVLPNRTRIVLAMNPADIAVNGHELEGPFANRMAHFPFQTPTIEQWGDYMLGRYRPDLIKFEEGEATVKREWFKHYYRVTSTIYEFMKANGGYHDVRTGKDKDGKPVITRKWKLHNPPEPESEQVSGPWPSLRTWSWTIFGITTIRCLGLDPRLEIDMAECLIGPAVATELASYLAKADLPKPEDALNGNWELPKRVDIIRATINAATEWAIKTKDPMDRLEWIAKSWKLLKRVYDAGHADILLGSAESLIHNKFGVIDCKDPRVIDACTDVCAAIARTKLINHIRH
jgi:hypothetical protein